MNVHVRREARWGWGNTGAQGGAPSADARPPTAAAGRRAA
eukprot:CAMPEP_0204318654 /NCGR_PEP_ID=MMETSP0469-20131031/6660_1 /ASSEMBLY_ACC=CAM_ASM_000384 /TAXON_ID=2969 /ORGANISM="Oxyrrhis marina" /LENGTH=39 /DNA_ID= /DNA_START= /DNA_END= /DNA_ORIENTATION=